MSFKIMPYGGQRYSGHYADHDDIRQYLGFKRGAKLPLGYTSSCTWLPLTDGRTTVMFVRPGNPAPEGPRRWSRKSSAHRCLVSCPDCGAAVPAGRTHQHKCKPIGD